MSEINTWLRSCIVAIAARIGLHPAVLLVSVVGAMVGAIAGWMAAVVSAQLLGDESSRPIYVE